MGDKGKKNFLCITLTKHCDQFKVATYRKPATADRIISNYSRWESISAKIFIFDRM